ncbi:MAG: propanediol dehydratase [Clostridiales Family XIII bacterium]|nr:propanediol dehydratase [Clostridiales Family XIII bacterium]
MNDNARLKTFRNILEDANACGPDGEDIDIREIGDAERGKRKDEVVIAVSPSFGSHQKKTLGDIPHLRVLDEVIAGIEEEGLRARCVKCYESSDLGVIASIGAKLSGSGIGVGIQSKGTSEIQQKDFSPLFNLELFSQAPLLDREAYRKIGGSAARYAKGETPEPLPARIDPSVHPLLIKSSVLHYFDTQRIVRRKKPVEFTYVEKGAKE